MAVVVNECGYSVDARRPVVSVPAKVPVVVGLQLEVMGSFSPGRSSNVSNVPMLYSIRKRTALSVHHVLANLAMEERSMNIGMI